MRKLLALVLLLFPLACSTTPTDTNAAPAYLVAQDETGRAQPPRDEQIRGNKRTKIYHWPGCPNYGDISPHNIVPFRTRAEAEAAGYRAARNCPR